ncbi:hypothetical protein Q2838_000315 [Escherichia coli]|uniref:hypothetical protein n=1 Tax=Escherichia coli TaxID=562 RepID=UPI000570CEE6|nr:hypothetical protein [Escherichia coli]EGO7966290.1 hypothetical protein [Escherichia coli]EGO7974151.1 hypothetical protein [Escherichia coli]EGO7979694.1 hypothetical protein [Escherichia coli]EGO8001877.1 hypothetical protein [Escherichia coli]EJK7921439.1 hypothetical protein [Escherichia coli]
MALINRGECVRKIKSHFLLILSASLLYGCSITPPTTQQQQSEFGDKEYVAKSGESWTVNRLKNDYLKKTGMILVAPDTTQCGWDGECYYNVWANAYDSGINAFNNKKRAEKKLAEEKCLADKECRRKKELSSSMNSLSTAYTVLLSVNHYAQAEYDAAVRAICEQTSLNQKKGIPKDALVNRMKDWPGIAPMDREYFTEVVQSCWDISRLSGDWRKAIRR